MSWVTHQDVEEALKHFHPKAPYDGLNVGSILKSVDIRGGVITLHCQLDFPMFARQMAFSEQISAYLRQTLQHVQVDSLEIDLNTKILAHAPQNNLSPIDGIQNIIAVVSGKGGVGKSTTAVNLALALQAEGARVGLLDADIYGPSQPQLLGAPALSAVVENEVLQPVVSHGLKTMSIGFLVAEEKATIWRGPMASSALKQLLNQTDWGTLDYLIVDLPPGTGDIPLTMAQSMPVSGAVVVTTPQDVALNDVRKSLAMLERVQIPVLGVLENMSFYHCAACGVSDALFGAGGAKRLSEEFSVPLLGQIPLVRAVREGGDLGVPIVVSDREHAASQAYWDAAGMMTVLLSKRPRSYAQHFKNVVVERAEHKETEAS